MTDNDIRRVLKWAGQELDYPETRGIPIERINTPLLQGGSANALSLNGYSDTQIQKRVHQRGARELFVRHVKGNEKVLEVYGSFRRRLP